LEDGLARLAEPGVPPGMSVPPLLVLAHRLRGSAALHGFPGVSELASVAESRLRALAGVGPTERAATAGALGELVRLFKDLFDGIAVTGSEDADRIAAFQARRGAADGDERSPGTAPGAPAEPAAGTRSVSDEIAADVDPLAPHSIVHDAQSAA